MNKYLYPFTLAFVLAATAAFAQDATVAIPVPAGLPSWATALWTTIVTPAAVTGLVSWLVAFLPQGTPGTAWGVIRSVLDIVAANILNSKNAPKA